MVASTVAPQPTSSTPDGSSEGLKRPKVPRVQLNDWAAARNMHEKPGPGRVDSFLPRLGSHSAAAPPGCGGHCSDRRREASGVPLYYFKLVDSIIVADHGVHELVDDAAARVEAIKLARSLRETRPQLRGSHYSISVTAEDGTGVCLVALDDT